MTNLSLGSGLRLPGGETQATAVKGSASAPMSPARKELHKAADEFEAMLLTSLWKSFKESSLGDSDSDSSDAGGNTLQNLGLQAMSTAVASSGGFGIGRMIEQQLAPDLKQEDGKSTELPPLPSIS